MPTTKQSPAVALAAQKQSAKSRRRCADQRTDRKYPLTCGMRERRNELGLTLREVADAIGLSAAGLRHK